MASISSITLPDNSRYDLKDAKLKGIYSVKGTQNSETSQWTGNINVDSLTDGLSIAYYLPVGSSDNVTLNLTLADNTVTGPVDVYMTSTKRVGTEYSAGSIVYLTYYNAGSISVNGNLSLAPRWIVSNDLKEKITNAEIDQLFGDVGTSGTIYSIMQGATSAADGHEGFVPAPVIGDQVKFLRGDGTWAIPTDTTYNVMVGATSSAPGQVGLVPAPATGDEKKFLRGDGSWISPIANMTTTQLGDILDATIGKELKDDVDGLAEEIANVIDFRKITVLTQGDLNTFNSSDQNGIYYLSKAYSTFENCPSGGGWGFLLNFTKPDSTAPSYQIIFNKDYFLFRGYSGNPATWGDWHQLIYSVTNNAPTLAWGTTSTVGTIGSIPLTVTMPANPNTWPGNFTAPTSSANGNAGLVPAPSSGWYSTRHLVYLCANGAWQYLDASGVLVNNLTTTAAHYALDARQGKVLNDKIDAVNTAFTNYKSTIVRGFMASGTDLNTVQVSGFYRINANHANAPSGVDYGQLLVIQGGSDTIAQMVFPYKSTTFYIRVGNVVGNTTGSWTSWRAI